MNLRQMIFLVCAVSVTSVFAGENLLKNGDFEQSQHTKDFRGYDRLSPGQLVFCNIDKEIKHSGKQSIRISGLEKTWVALIQHGFKLEDFKKPLLVRGWCKYENFVSKLPSGRPAGTPFIGLWSLTRRGTNGPGLSIPGLFKEGSKDWFKFEYVFTPESAKKRFSSQTGQNAVSYLAFRINISAQTATFWFDDLELIELEPEPFIAKLPLPDVSGKTLKVEIDVSNPKPECVVGLTVSGQKEFVVKVPKAKNSIEVPLNALANGKYVLTVTPKGGFPADTKAVKLFFSKQASAFDEE